MNVRKMGTSKHGYLVETVKKAVSLYDFRHPDRKQLKIEMIEKSKKDALGLGWINTLTQRQRLKT